MKTLKYSLIIFATFFLANCASLQSTPQTTSWPLHQRQLTQLTQWQLKAAIGIRTPTKSGMATLLWHQSLNHYNARVSGPLGIGGIRIYGDKNRVTLWKSTTEKVSAATPEALMYRQLGWVLPISGLYYWIRGIPIPHVAAKIQTNNQGLLTTLTQAGWQIQYSNYQFVDNKTLPTKLLLVKQDLQIKIVVERWQLQ